MIQERAILKVVPIRFTRSVTSESRIRDFAIRDSWKQNRDQ